MSNLWPHQLAALDEIESAVEQGFRNIALTIPTGGGKTRTFLELVKRYKERGIPSVVYTHRRLLTNQASSVFTDAGLTHGLRASGYDPALLRDVQIASIHTENIRVYQQEKWEHHKAGLVIVDEAHNQTSAVPRKIIKHHLDEGAVVIGPTATPVGLTVSLDGVTDARPLYSKLIVAGRNSDLRACGAHIPCDTYAPDEPDMKHVRRNAVGEYNYKDVVKKIMCQTVFGSVLKHYKKYNPGDLPTILFAPGVAESMWFAEFFNKQGISAAHIDATTEDNERQDILAASKEGRIKVLCNRFVMREGVDAPWLAHCIMATVFGALSNFLQAGGRLLRSYPGLERVVLQDHGGSWWRFGSLNQDREWELGDTDVTIAKKTKEKASKGEPEPIVCPKCAAVRKAGPKCWKCGHEHKRSVRMVVQKDGTLKRMLGNVHKPKKSDAKSTDEKRWGSVLYACANAKVPKTFEQASLWYKKKYGQWPPFGLKHMPTEPPGHYDWKKKVADELPWMRSKNKDAI